MAVENKRPLAKDALAFAQMRGEAADDVVAAVVDGQLKDWRDPIPEGASVRLVHLNDPEALQVLRHTAAHLLAQAALRLFPGTKLGTGPATQEGFYYDMAFETPLTQADLPALEAEMQHIVTERLPIDRREVSREEALELFAQQPFKCEIISGLPEGARITVYTQGGFTDLCAGPHVQHTGQVGALRLLSLAGAYWRGKAGNPMLTRVYGTAFADETALARHLEMTEEAKRRDHRVLGRELKLFTFVDEAPGMPIFLPNGMALRNTLESFWREEHRLAGYQEIRTPMMMNRSLWERSGHWDHYKDNMYFTDVEGVPYAVKPMNCPGAILAYQSESHSYRDLPLRYAELGLVHRFELSGTLHGLLRVRAFTQDDAHLFVTPDQMEAELARVLELVDHIYRVFGFPYRVELSTRPQDAMGSEELWERAEAALKQVLEERAVPYTLNPGEGAFYGPKIDFHIQDALGRFWQCGTVQLDFQMPEKFAIEYIGEDNQPHRPIVIHRAIFGSIERFIAILTEQYVGAFPLWLAPVQVKVLPIASAHEAYARHVAQYFVEHGLRAVADLRDGKIGQKIRQAELEKVPYMAVVGNKELDSQSVAVRKRGVGDVGPQPYRAFTEELLDEIRRQRQRREAK
ncbi:MAG: threonine--tRNA ligase [Firmicutes bacterium]|nr:threonine--tRNA ligase [Bacillota bacterium]